MKIVQLKTENIKRLSAVEITPDGSVVKISGKNASGKTSVLDSIWWAMGGADHIQGKPINKDAEKACIHLDLGDIQVDRKFTDKGTTLTVTNKDGARYQSPQAVLDNLVGKLAFDPLEFMRLKPAEQFKQLRGIVVLDGDIDALDIERKEIFEERTIANRLVKEKAGAVKNNPIDDDAPAEIVSAAELINKINDAEDSNRQRQILIYASETSNNHVITLLDDLTDYKDYIKSNTLALKNKLDEDIKLRQEIHENDLLAMEDKLAEKVKAHHAQQTIAETAIKDAESKVLVEVDALRTELANIETNNEAARNRQKAFTLFTEHSGAVDNAAALTDKIKDIDGKKLKIMSAAKFPTDGLTFDDGVVIYNSLPLEQASSAEQLKISMSIAMAANPKFRVIRITDGSLMDSSSFEIIEQMATDNDFQVWVEVVDETGSVGVVIEDGKVARINSENDSAEGTAEGTAETEDLFNTDNGVSES